ncbi:sumo-activating enzyme subunit 1a [Quercus suber]|uniref:Sumo-activating enzyme subunit 1a n=1 Tax=Quercus suber TaxID=58331 RepID=A0AAW0LSM4_QUESU
MDGEELTEQETALYDRQIRVWGADAQRRLSKSHILFCKNIVLAGVGSLTLVDDRVATDEALFSSNFLIPPDENVYRGKTLAELCCDSLKDFNPMVRVSVEKGDVSSFDGEFFNKYDVVVVSCCSLATKKSVNEKCRKLSKHIAFYTVDCRDSSGEIFVDLQDHIYSKFCKNIVLAGVGSLTLVDDRVATDEALFSSNFLIPPDENVYRGKTLAELCCDSLKDFNPMVRVSVEKGDVSSFDGEFFNKYDVVVVSCCSLATKKSVNEKCRKLSKHIAFYTVDCRDSSGEIFVDLQDHIYSKKKLEETVECKLQYPSFEV